MNEYDKILAVSVLKGIKGIGAVALKKLALIGVFENNSFSEILSISLEALKKSVSTLDLQEHIDKSCYIIEKAHKSSINILSIVDSKYPANLFQIKDPPPVLFYKGNTVQQKMTIGIIGTRAPDQIGAAIAYKVGLHFQDGRYNICNGLADGVDGISITNNDQAYGHSIGVLSGGLDYSINKTISKSASILADKVIDAGGLIVSEFEPGIKENPFNLIKSCRTQAGLSDGLILIQSKLDGGSKYTLEAFCQSERPLGVINPTESANTLNFAANSEIINNGLVGLAKCSGVKIEKIKTKYIIPIAHKSDYNKFENLINNTNTDGFSGTLF